MRHGGGCQLHHQKLMTKLRLVHAGASSDTDNDIGARTVRKSTSRKQLQFAPLQLGRISEQPQKSPSAQGFEDELLFPGRSKSLGSAVDCALLKEAVDADLAVTKDRPHSATQFSRKVSVQAWNGRYTHCLLTHSHNMDIPAHVHARNGKQEITFVSCN